MAFCFSLAAKMSRTSIGRSDRLAVKSNQPLVSDLGKMYRATLLVTLVLLQGIFAASAERIKRKPPDDAEIARLATDQAMNDGILRKGDIISTDRGFLQLRGLKEDGSYDFAPVPNPLSTTKQAPRR
jgi:hypothetical protein